MKEGRDMEEVIGFLGFSLGATLGAGLVRSMGGEGRPMLRQVLKVGIQTWDAVAGAGGAGAGAAQSAGADLVLPGSASTATRARSRRRAEPRRIAIARE
jgi:hypothetical protein